MKRLITKILLKWLWRLGYENPVPIYFAKELTPLMFRAESRISTCKNEEFMRIAKKTLVCDLAAKVAEKLTENVEVGVEHYNDDAFVRFLAEVEIFVKG